MSSALTTRTRVGLVLAVLLALADVVSAFFPTPDGEVGPPLAIVILGGVIGLATLAAVAVAWRSGRRGRPTERGALRIVAGTRVLSAITALPAFFVDVPAWLKLVVAVLVVLTVVCVVLVLTPARQPATISD